MTGGAPWQWIVLVMLAFPGLIAAPAAAVVAGPRAEETGDEGPVGTFVKPGSLAVPEWHDLAPLTAPPGRSAAALAYDAASDRAVLFGGRAPGSQIVDYTWSFDYRSNNWSDMAPPVKPSPREATRMAYVESADRMILFGGAPALQDTWEYHLDNNTWAIVNTASIPAGRGYQCMVYDSRSDRIVMFGGMDGSLTHMNDTWVFDHRNTTWTRMYPTSAPPPTAAPGCAYDELWGMVVLFGGTSPVNGAFVNHTWAYHLATNNWTRMSPLVTPSPRSAPGMAYDPESDLVLLFSGLTGTHTDDTWYYDLGADRWQQIATPRSPPLRSDAMLAHVSRHDRTVLFGGNFGGNGRADTWAFVWRNANDRTPSEPLNLAATGGDRKISLVWQPPADSGSTSVSAYRIYRSAIAGQESFLAEVGNTSMFEDAGLAPGQGYFYRVSARNAAGESPLSIEASAVVPTGPVIVGWQPSNGSFNPPAFQPITVTFDQPMNASSVLAAFSIAPPLANLTVVSNGGNVLEVYHNSTPFVASTLYTINVSRTARSALGVNMSSDSWSTFTTGAAPAVTTTIPAVNATSVALTSWVRVYFNQAMDAVSTSTSFNITPYLPGTVTMTSARMTWTHAVQFDLLTTYTVRVNMSARSTMGYPLASDFVFTFTTIGSTIPPAVVNTVPANFAQDVAPFQNVTVQFSMPMQPSSTMAAFSISPFVAGVVGVAGSTLYWNHSSRFTPGATYTVQIASSAASVGGSQMNGDYNFQFQATLVTPWPKVTSTAPGDGSANVPLDIRVTVIFDQAMDPVSTIAAFSMSPSAGGATTQVTGGRLYWDHTEPLQPLTTYSGIVSASASSVNGIAMAADYPFQFTTAPFVPNPPSVTMTPADGAVGVGVTIPLVFSFTEPMEHAATEDAISTAPQANLQFSWSADSRSLTATAGGGWQGNAAYIVTVRPSARSQAGSTLLARYESTFTTAAVPFGVIDPGLASALTLAGCAIVGAVLFVVGLLLLQRFRKRGAASAVAPPGAGTMPAVPVPTSMNAPPAPIPGAAPVAQDQVEREEPRGSTPPPAQSHASPPPPPSAAAAQVPRHHGGPPPPPPSTYGASALEVPRGSLSGPPPGEPVGFVTQPPPILKETRLDEGVPSPPTQEKDDGH